DQREEREDPHDDRDDTTARATRLREMRRRSGRRKRRGLELARRRGLSDQPRDRLPLGRADRAHERVLGESARSKLGADGLLGERPAPRLAVIAYVEELPHGAASNTRRCKAAAHLLSTFGARLAKIALWHLRCGPEKS